MQDGNRRTMNDGRPRAIPVSPLWRKAPLTLVRFPALFLAIAASGLLLSLAVSSGFLFVSSAGSSVLRNELSDATRFGAGASITYDAVPARVHPSEPTATTQIERLNVRAGTALADVRHLDPPVFTLLGATATPGTTRFRSSERPLRLITKTDALAHVQKVRGRDGDGFWITDSAAESLAVDPGDSIYLNSEVAGGQVRVSIDGVYRALGKEPSTPYWRSLSALIYEGQPAVGPSPTAGPPPTFLIGDEEQVVDVSAKLGHRRFELRWEWPLDTTALTQEEAELVAHEFNRFQREARGWARPIRIPVACKGCPTSFTPQVSYSSFLPTALTRARQTTSTLRAPADVLSTAGALVAAAVVAAGAAFTLARRRTEVALLFARGVNPIAFGGRAALESLAPLALGAAAGFVLALLLVTVLGPGPIDRGPMGRAAAAAALAVPVALALLAFVVAASFAKQAGVRAGALTLRRSIPWELAVLTLAGFFLAKLLANGALVAEEPEAVARPSLYLLLFPIVLIAGAAGLGARALTRLLRWMRRGDRPSAPAGYLALRRLTASHALARLFITAGALALGIFVYAQAVVASYDQTVRDKALLSVGSDLAGQIGPEREAPEGFPYPVTKVTQVYSAGELAPTGTPIDVLAIDPATFPAAAHWHGRYADRPLAEITADLASPSGSSLPIVLVGDVAGTPRALIVGSASVPVEVVERARAFPGSSQRDPRVVVDASAFTRLLEEAGEENRLEASSSFTELWVKGEPTGAARALASSASAYPTFTAEELRRGPSISAFTRTFGFLKSLGVAAAALTLVAALLYLQARQRNRIVASALARRMGLSASAHRLAVALELGGMLLTSFIFAAMLALAAARLVLTRIEPLATLTPVPLFDTPLSTLAAALLALVAVALAGAWLTSWAAERAKVAEVMRLDT